MRIRPYIPQLDFDTIETWNIDERTHALWCARILPYPVERESFHQKLGEVSARTGDTPFVMTSDDGNVEGFFSYSLNLETNEGMLKFVMVAPDQRGKGLGQEMLKLAALYAFTSTKADAVRLVVFSENERAKHCYESVGFTVVSDTTDAFQFKEESWGRCNMILRKEQTE